MARNRSLFIVGLMILLLKYNHAVQDRILIYDDLTFRVQSVRYDADRGQGIGPKGAGQGLTSKSARSKAAKETTISLQRVKCDYSISFIYVFIIVSVCVKAHAQHVCKCFHTLQESRDM